MGSKISILVYEWSLMKCRIWYMNGLIFQKFAQIKENFGKICFFCSKFSPKLDWLVYEWVTFLKKLVFAWVYFQILRWHVPTKTKLEYPLTPGIRSLFSLAFEQYGGSHIDMVNIYLPVFWGAFSQNLVQLLGGFINDKGTQI